MSLHSAHSLSDTWFFLFILVYLSRISVFLPVCISRVMIPNLNCAKKEGRDLERVWPVFMSRNCSIFSATVSLNIFSFYSGVNCSIKVFLTLSISHPRLRLKLTMFLKNTPQQINEKTTQLGFSVWVLALMANST